MKGEREHSSRFTLHPLTPQLQTRNRSTGPRPGATELLQFVAFPTGSRRIPPEQLQL